MKIKIRIFSLLVFVLLTLAAAYVGVVFNLLITFIATKTEYSYFQLLVINALETLFSVAILTTLTLGFKKYFMGIQDVYGILFQRFLAAKWPYLLASLAMIAVKEEGQTPRSRIVYAFSFIVVFACFGIVLYNYTRILFKKSELDVKLLALWMTIVFACDAALFWGVKGFIVSSESCFVLIQKRLSFCLQ